MDYFPNIDAACEFAIVRLPELRRSIAGLEFWIVGRSPAPRVKKLAGLSGVRISGTVADVRPYVQNALAAVAPLRIARGIQNKVLEALAMDKPALISPATARTFGDALPYGVVACESTADYARALGSLSGWEDGAIRARAQARFRWSTALAPLDMEIESLAGAPA
jgi:glycosyltransferase involved in cell wall biosynthesis